MDSSAYPGHYRSANAYFRERFGKKLYKLALDGGFTCPNRDGTTDTRGCIFCSGGSGDFAVPCGDNVYQAIENAKHVVAGKGGEGYIAYFQSFTGTYAPLSRLRELYFSAAAHPDIEAIAVGTRPDCLPDDVVDLLEELNGIKPVFTELGLQTIHAETAKYIRRGYELPVFDDAAARLKKAGLNVIVHMIIGLPGETENMIVKTAKYIGRSGADGIKLQLLHVLRNTDLAADYAEGLFKTMTQDEYIHTLERCIENIPPEMVVHRLTGDGAKRDLIAPLWSADKKRVLAAVNAAFDRDNIKQGSAFSCI